jgi:glycosyltransferase involved in cell wall biosynthesis
VDLAAEGVEVERHGYGDDYYRLLSTFDVGLSPILGGDLGSRAKVAMKHQEFMLCGIPQVCSRVAICERIVDGETAVVAGGPDEWASGLLRLLTDEALRERLGRASRALFLEMYTYEVEYPKLRAVLTSTN